MLAYCPTTSAEKAVSIDGTGRISDHALTKGAMRRKIITCSWNLVQRGEAVVP